MIESFLRSRLGIWFCIEFCFVFIVKLTGKPLSTGPEMIFLYSVGLEYTTVEIYSIYVLIVFPINL